MPTKFGFGPLFDQIREAVMVIDSSSGEIVLWNSAAETLTGYSRDDAIGQSISMLFAGDSSHREISWIAQAAGDGPTDHASQPQNALQIVRRGGARLEADIRVLTPDQSPSDSSRYLVLLARDLTEQHLALQEAERLRQLQASILDAASEGLCGVDSDGVATFVNAAAARMLGYFPEEISGRPFDEIVHAARSTEEHTTCAIRGVLRDGALHETADDLFRRRDGSHVSVDVVCTPIADGDGQLNGAVVAFRDITARKQADALRERAARHAALRLDVVEAFARRESLQRTLQFCTEAIVERLDAAFARIWTLSASEDVLELQASAGMYTHLNGQHGRVPVGTYKIGLIAQERQPHLTNDVANDPRIGDPQWAAREGMAAFAGYPLLVEERLVGVLAIFSRTPQSDDSVTALGIVADIVAQGVERRRAEEALALRAAELARSNADLEQFAYVASHDLQEPLRMVVSYLQLLERRYRGRLDENADEFIGYAVDGARRMQQLIGDLLTYSRVGRADRELIRLDSGLALDRALGNLRSVIEEARATVTRGELPEIVADETQLVQLFQNLISNAVKFRTDRPPVVRVWSERQSDGWLFGVRDNGIGIAEEFGERIFVIFKRLHGRDEFAGTGIGLAICKRIVERLGGRIWVESRPGEGAAFFFTVPDRKESLG